MKHNRPYLLISAALIALVVSFQNCSDVRFSSEPQTSPSSTGAATSLPPIGDESFSDITDGLVGGHFDLDTSSKTYPFSQGATDRHIHEYDDKFGVTYADYFNLKDPKLQNINSIVGPSTPFVLVIANAQLSTGGVLSINGSSTSVGAYQSKVVDFRNGQAGALQVFTLDGSQGVKLSSLRIGFAPDAILAGGLIGTETGCVVSNDPGKLGEYRNGALTIQAISVSGLKLDPMTGAATIDGGLLWESTIFHHWDNGCYR